jgi:hypothetical protein
MKFYIATLETRHFTFEAPGLNPDAARRALTRLLDRHEKDNALGEGGYWYDPDDIETRELELGKGYRDREEYPRCAS